MLRNASRGTHFFQRDPAARFAILAIGRNAGFARGRLFGDRHRRLRKCWVLSYDWGSSPLRSPAYSSVAQWQSIRLLTGGLLVRVQPEEPLTQLRFVRGSRAVLSGAAFGFASA